MPPHSRLRSRTRSFESACCDLLTGCLEPAVRLLTIGLIVNICIYAVMAQTGRLPDPNDKHSPGPSTSFSVRYKRTSGKNSNVTSSGNTRSGVRVFINNEDVAQRAARSCEPQ